MADRRKNNDLSIADYVQAARFHPWAVVVPMVVIGIVTWLALGRGGAEYEASARVVIAASEAQQGFEQGGNNSNDPNFLANEVRFAKGDAVLTAVSATLGADAPDNLDDLDVEVAADTEADLLTFTARADTSQGAADLANSYATIYVDQRRANAVAGYDSTIATITQELEQLRNDRAVARQELDAVIVHYLPSREVAREPAGLLGWPKGLASGFAAVRKDHFRLHQVAPAAVGARSRVGDGHPVLDYPDHTVILEHAPDGGEGLAAASGLGFEAVEVVQGANQQDPVDGAGNFCGYFIESEARGPDPVIGKPLDHFREFPGGRFPRCNPLIRGIGEQRPYAVGVIDSVQGTLGTQVVGEDIGVPARARQHFRDGHSRLHPEKLQCLQRVAGAVPGPVFGAARCNDLFQERIVGGAIGGLCPAARQQAAK